MGLHGRREIIFEDYDLTRAEYGLMKANSRGVFSLAEFIPKREILLATDDGECNGNALGIKEFKKVLAPYEIACKAFSLRDCMNFSGKYNIPSEVAGGPPYAELAMEKLVEADIPCVFFLPKNARTHSKTYYVKQEINWALSHPESLGSILFVLELYEQIEKLGLGHPMTVEQCAQLLISNFS